MAQSTKQKMFQEQVDLIDPALAKLNTPAVKDAIAAARTAAAALDADISPAARAHLANLANMEMGIGEVVAERERMNAVANPPPAPATSTAGA